VYNVDDVWAPLLLLFALVPDTQSLGVALALTTITVHVSENACMTRHRSDENDMMLKEL